GTGILTQIESLVSPVTNAIARGGELALRSFVDRRPISRPVEDRTKFRQTIFGATLWLGIATSVQGSGLLVFRSESGLQFSDTLRVLVKEKEKALSRGTSPKLNGLTSKLGAIRLGTMPLMDADAGVVGVYEKGPVTYILPKGPPKGAPPDPAGLWKAATI